MFQIGNITEKVFDLKNIKMSAMSDGIKSKFKPKEILKPLI